jgi:hypothetical protein
MPTNAAISLVWESPVPETGDSDSQVQSLASSVRQTFLEMLTSDHKELASQSADARRRCEQAVEALRTQFDAHPDYGPDAIDAIVQRELDNAREAFANELEQDVPTLAKAYEDRLRNLT